MNKISITNIINIIKNSLSYIDERVIQHGERVAYIIYMMKKAENNLSAQEIYDYCILAMLHDIGAYKTEEMDNILKLDTFDDDKHTIYGYLYIKYFTSVKEKADAILYHHSSFEEIMNSDCINKDIARSIAFADRMDVFLTYHNSDDLSEFERILGDYVSHEDYSLFINANKDNIIIHNLKDGKNTEIIEAFFEDVNKNNSTYILWLFSLIFMIDFRSPITLAHTMTTAIISEEIAKRMALSEEEIQKVMLGAFLHDFGKINTPIEILQKEGSLNPKEMDIMKEHVKFTKEILSGNVNEEIMNIATRHHEKLDGSGYPYGLKGSELTQLEKIVAVADIASALFTERSYKRAYSVEKITSILSDMSNKGLICNNATSILINNKEQIFLRASNIEKEMKDYYNEMINEYTVIKSKRKIV